MALGTVQSDNRSQDADMYSASQVFFKRGDGMIKDVLLVVQFARKLVTLYIMAELHSV